MTCSCIFCTGKPGSMNSTVSFILSACEQVRNEAKVPCILPVTGTQPSGWTSTPMNALTNREA